MWFCHGIKIHIYLAYVLPCLLKIGHFDVGHYFMTSFWHYWMFELFRYVWKEETHSYTIVSIRRMWSISRLLSESLRLIGSAMFDATIILVTRVGLPYFFRKLKDGTLKKIKVSFENCKGVAFGSPDKHAMVSFLTPLRFNNDTLMVSRWHL